MRISSYNCLLNSFSNNSGVGSKAAAILNNSAQKKLETVSRRDDGEKNQLTFAKRQTEQSQDTVTTESVSQQTVDQITDPEGENPYTLLHRMYNSYEGEIESLESVRNYASNNGTAQSTESKSTTSSSTLNIKMDPIDVSKIMANKNLVKLTPMKIDCQEAYQELIGVATGMNSKYLHFAAARPRKRVPVGKNTGKSRSSAWRQRT